MQQLNIAPVMSVMREKLDTYSLGGAVLKDTPTWKFHEDSVKACNCMMIVGTCGDAVKPYDSIAVAHIRMKTHEQGTGMSLSSACLSVLS